MYKKNTCVGLSLYVYINISITKIFNFKVSEYNTCNSIHVESIQQDLEKNENNSQLFFFDHNNFFKKKPPNGSIDSYSF